MLKTLRSENRNISKKRYKVNKRFVVLAVIIALGILLIALVVREVCVS